MLIYPARTTGSNLEPITFELRDQRLGTRIDLTGATVTVNVKDEHTNEVIVVAGSGSVDGNNAALVSYSFSDAEVAKITYETTWLVEWTIVLSAKTYRSEQIRLPVRPQL